MGCTKSRARGQALLAQSRVGMTALMTGWISWVQTQWSCLMKKNANHFEDDAMDCNENAACPPELNDETTKCLNEAATAEELH